VRPTLQDFRIRVSRVSNVKQQHTTISEIVKEENVELTFQDFRIRGFGVSNVEPQHTTIPEF
jgi:hypothetical protein